MAARRRVVWSPRAQTSLDEVLSYVAESSREGALRILEQALAAGSSLATLSERGRIVPELDRPDFREIFVFRYRLIYQLQPDTVRIVAFLHGARDFWAWFRSQ